MHLLVGSWWEIEIDTTVGGFTLTGLLVASVMLVVHGVIATLWVVGPP